ncbi:MAG: glutamyl-tRNA reductase [Candidatus Acidiferrales bacterium]
MTTATDNSNRAGTVRIRVALIGCNHRTAPVELRERIVFSSQQALQAADELRDRGILEEAVVVSTCNRSELYGVPGDLAPSAAEAMEDYVASFHRIPRGELAGRFYRWSGPDAVRHLFRVAASLDSMLLGEAEILGQLRAAYNQALEHGATGPVLNRMFQAALEVGKRVRSETQVGTRPMSVALAGVKLAERVFGNLKGHSALILGAGAVAEQVVEHMRNRGIGNLRVINRSFDRAAELAHRFGGEAMAWESLESVLGAPDILVTSVGASGPVLTREMLERAIAARSGRPVFLVDLGVPRNVAENASGLYNLYLYNIDDLGEIVEQNKKARESEIPRAEAIIAEHIDKFEAWRGALEAGSIVNDLREQFHKHRELIIREKLKEMQDVSPQERDRLAHITEELIERLLEEPQEKLKHGRGMRGRLAGLEAIRHLFGLDEGKK